MMRTTPAGKAYVKRVGVMVLVSMGRRVSHPSIASWGKKRGCRLCSLASLCVVAVCASGSMSAHVYVACFKDSFQPCGDAAKKLHQVDRSYGEEEPRD